MFDWDDFKTYAETLKSETDEAAQRSAVSRLYYAVYWKARKNLEADGFFFSQYDGAHSQVWREYKKRGKTNFTVGKLGDRLRGNRVEADYIEEVENFDKIMSESFELADKIIYWLDRLRPKES